MSAETRRTWIRQAAADDGQAPGLTREASKEVRWRRKVSELERIIEVLSAASAFFTRARDPLHS
jgi:transposase-like protein